MTKIIGKHLVMALTAMVVILGSVPGSPRQAEDPAVLLRAAIEKEEVDGDLQSAVVLYERIVAKFSDNRPIAAKALLRLGGCYEKLGQSQAELAQKAFQRVVDSYPDQTEAVKAAKEKLAAFLKSRASAEKGGKDYVSPADGGGTVGADKLDAAEKEVTREAEVDDARSRQQDDGLP